MVTKTRLIKDQIFHVFLQKGPNRLYKDCFHSSTGKCDCALQYYSGKADSETGLPSQMSTGGPGQKLRQWINHRFFLQCKYCNRNHWSDQCLVYPTAQDRKQKLKDSCFLCLRRGHIAYKCMSNKSYFYCQCRLQKNNWWKGFSLSFREDGCSL